MFRKIKQLSFCLLLIFALGMTVTACKNKNTETKSVTQVAAEYNLTFKDGENVLLATKLKAGDVITAPSLPSKQGFRSSWDKEVPSTMPSSDLVVNVVYTAIEYTITFQDDEGNTIGTAKFTINDTSVTEPTIPTKEGYTGAFEAYELTPGNKTVKVVYTVNKYRVIFVDHSGEVSNELLDFNSPISAPQTTPENYVDSETGKTKIFVNWGSVDETVPAHDVTYTAVYRFEDELTVTFKNANGGVFKTSMVEKNGKVAAPADTPSKDGYVFDKWMLGNEPYDFNSEVTESIELTPSFTLATYTITFKADGEVVGTVEFNVETTSITEPAIPEKDGYTGVWGTYDFTFGDKEVNAVYTIRTYSVVFKAGETVVSTLTYTIDNKTVEAPNVPEKDGYTGAWAEYNLETLGDKEVNAIYTPIEYGIGYYYMEGASNAGNPETYNIETGLTLVNPTKENWVFDNWYSNPQCTEVFNGLEPGATGYFEVFAKFKPESSKINEEGNVTYSNTEYALYYASTCANTILSISETETFNGEQVLEWQLPWAATMGFIYFHDLPIADLNAKDSTGNYLYNYLYFYVKCDTVGVIGTTNTWVSYFTKGSWQRIVFNRNGDNFQIATHDGFQTLFGSSFTVSDFKDGFSIRSYPDANDNTMYLSTVRVSKYLPEIEEQLTEPDNITYFNKDFGLDFITSHADTLVYTTTEEHLPDETNSLRWNVTWAGWRSLVFDLLPLTNLNAKDELGEYLYDYVYFYVKSDTIDGLNINGFVWKVPFATGSWQRIVLTRSGDTFVARDSYGTDTPIFGDSEQYTASPTNFNKFVLMTCTEQNNLDLYISAFRAVKTLPDLYVEPEPVVSGPKNLTKSDTAEALNYASSCANTTLKISDTVTLDGEQVLEWGLPWAGTFGYLYFNNLPVVDLNAKDDLGEYLYDYIYFYVKSDTIGGIGTNNTWVTYFTKGSWQRIVFTRDGENFKVTSHDGTQAIFGGDLLTSDFNGFSLRAYPEANGNTVYVSTVMAVKTLPELYVEPEPVVAGPKNLTLSDTAEALSYASSCANTTLKISETETLDGEQVLEWGLPWAGLFGYLYFNNLPVVNLNAKDEHGDYLYDYIYFYVKSETLGSIGTNNTWVTYFTTGSWQRIVFTRDGENFKVATHDGTQAIFGGDLVVSDFNGFHLRSYPSENGNTIYVSKIMAVKTLPELYVEPEPVVVGPKNLTLADTEQALSYASSCANTTLKISETVTLDGEQVLEWGLPWAGLFGYLYFNNLPVVDLNAKDDHGEYLYDYIYFYVKSETLGSIGTNNTWATYFTTGSWQRIVFTRDGENFRVTTHDGTQAIFGGDLQASDFNGFHLRSYPSENGNTIYVSKIMAVKTLPELYVEPEPVVAGPKNLTLADTAEALTYASTCANTTLKISETVTLDGEQVLEWGLPWASTFGYLYFNNLPVVNLNAKDEHGEYIYDYIYFYVKSDTVGTIGTNNTWVTNFTTGSWQRIVFTRDGENFRVTTHDGTQAIFGGDLQASDFNGFHLRSYPSDNGNTIYVSKIMAVKTLPELYTE